jgi:3-methyladenine DNA glycosylase AlkD
MHPVIAGIREELNASADEKTRKSFQRFFKEEVACYGVKTAVVRKIAKKYWRKVKDFSKAEVFALCETLFGSDFVEEAFVASFWLPNMLERLEPADLTVFKVWIERYVNNWAKCDTFCNHTVGGLVERHPESVCELIGWAESGNRWLRRAAAVSLIVPAKKGLFLQEALEISTVLLDDEDDMVQKGYGWLLKEESRKHQKEVLAFVLRNREMMPLTALRYAIELMPKDAKSEALNKDRLLGD